MLDDTEDPGTAGAARDPVVAPSLAGVLRPARERREERDPVALEPAPVGVEVRVPAEVGFLECKLLDLNREIGPIFVWVCGPPCDGDIQPTDQVSVR